MGASFRDEFVPYMNAADGGTTLIGTLQERHARCIEIGPESDVDRVTVKPGNDNPRVIAVGCPLVGELQGPFQVSVPPGFGGTPVSSLYKTAATMPRLQLRVHQVVPPLALVARAAAEFVTATLTLAAGYAAALEIPFYARQRCTVWIERTGGTAAITYKLCGRIYLGATVKEFDLTADTVLAAGSAGDDVAMTVENEEFHTLVVYVKGSSSETTTCRARVR